MCAVRVTVVVPCVCMYVCVCVSVCLSVHSFLPPPASQYRYVRVHCDTEKPFIIVIFAKNASFRSYGVICLPLMSLTNPKRRIPKKSAEDWKALIVMILTENASFRSYGTFTYLLRAHRYILVQVDIN